MDVTSLILKCIYLAKIIYYVEKLICFISSTNQIIDYGNYNFVVNLMFKDVKINSFIFPPQFSSATSDRGPYWKKYIYFYIQEIMLNGIYKDSTQQYYVFNNFR